MSLAFIDTIITLSGQNCRFLYDCLCDFRIFIDAPLNSPVWKDIFKHQNLASSFYRSDSSSNPKLKFSLKLETPSMRGSSPSTQGVYGLNPVFFHNILLCTYNNKIYAKKYVKNMQ